MKHDLLGVGSWTGQESDSKFKCLRLRYYTGLQSLATSPDCHSTVVSHHQSARMSGWLFPWPKRVPEDEDQFAIEAHEHETIIQAQNEDIRSRHNVCLDEANSSVRLELHPDGWTRHYSDELGLDPEQPPTALLRDLETRAITVSQLIQEAKGIYAGLVMVEKKCIEIVTQQAQNPNKLNKEQWQALIALHRTLLNKHHNFFKASHHPVTEGHELRELATRYAMPARMWRHGIHAFLELLRSRLPETLEHMLSFVYLAYSMMALLKETVSDFMETWIECLGDLARYRMAIEEADLRDRECWSATARTWYNEAADLSPNTGMIQHHLAVLARPNIVQQLSLYSKALVAAIPFKNASESILLLLDPMSDQIGARDLDREVAREIENFNHVGDAPRIRKSGAFQDDMQTRDRLQHKKTERKFVDSLWSAVTCFRRFNAALVRSISPRWLAAAYLSHVPTILASPIPQPHPSLTNDRAQTRIITVVYDFLIPIAILTFIIGCDLLTEHTRYRQSSDILRTMNSKARTFWSTFTPGAAAAMLSLCDEAGAERFVFMFLLGCISNQFRRCAHKVMSGPEAIVVMAICWFVLQHFLVKLIVHDQAMQKVTRWMLASFVITIGTKLWILFRRLGGSDAIRHYDNTHVSNGFAIFGDLNLNSRV